MTVTKPVRVLFPVLLVSDKVPAVIVVLPITAKATAPVVNVPPLIIKLPFSVKAVVCVHVAVPFTLVSPSVGLVGVHVLIPEPLNETS